MMQRALRILTAVAAFDGHDASVLALNRALLMGDTPVEVIYLGFNMTGENIAEAALQEGADAVAVSSYNGGHLQFFPHLVKRLREKGSGETLVFGGGGGTILVEDARELEAGGVAKIYGPGWPLDGIARDMVQRIVNHRSEATLEPNPATWAEGVSDPVRLSSLLTLTESRPADNFPGLLQRLTDRQRSARIVAIAGDGGSGKSTLIDELVRNFLAHFPDKRVAVLANDPSIATGQATTAFLADRVRMNAIYHHRVWLRSVATGSAYAPLSPHLPQMLGLFCAAGYDLVLVETPGTGQTGLDLQDLQANLLIYVKTREYGSSLQLQKDQLLRDAGLVVLNKVDLEGAEAACSELRGVLAELGKQDSLFPTTSKAVRDPGTSRLFAGICQRLGWPAPEAAPAADIFSYAKKNTLVPHPRRAYLAQIAEKVRSYDRFVDRELHQIRSNPFELARLHPSSEKLLEEWPTKWRELSLQAATRMGIAPFVQTPNGFKLLRVALPDPEDRHESLRFLLEE
ncbi:cobalamin-dependent protein, partial [Geomonas sp.]|uniref:cobalamin-dependent protein n=1 Tax=Geomonas sp. TaxID=2651584 RepID=UPI002B45AF7B